MSAIVAPRLTGRDYAAFVTGLFVDDDLAGDDAVRVVVVDSADPALPEPGSLPFVVAALAERFGDPGPEWADLVVAEADVADLEQRIESNPMACAALAVHMRAVVSLAVEAGLAAESAVYSTLQGGPEFARWRERVPRRPSQDRDATVLVEREGDRLVVTLHRPHRHNAISRRLRDDLVDALRPAVADPTITTVLLCGNGPSFSSGGDLDDFGERADPASAHLVRLTRSPARLLERLGPRTTASIHGATLGGGLELAAFARRVGARPGTLMGLPEIELGLIPGAGGTVSITRRVGRQRTAALGLTGRRIDVDTALRWGLVDVVLG